MIADADDDLVAGLQEFLGTDRERLVPGPDVAARVVLDLELGPARRFGRDVAQRLGIDRLQRGLIVGRAEGDDDAAEIVSAELTALVSEGERRNRPGGKAARRA